MRTFSVSLALALVIPTLACEVETLDVGENQGGSGNVGGKGGSLGTLEPSAGTGGRDGAPIERPAEPSPRTCDTDASLEKFVGVWEGAEENFAFEPIKPLRLEIRGATMSDVCGSFLMGELDLPPPVVDPDADYPPAAWKGDTGHTRLTGVPYELTGGARASTLRISVSRYQLWRDWCALQEPVFAPDGSAYPSCIEYGTSGMTEEDICTLNTVDYGPMIYPDFRCTLCGPRAPVCGCTAAGCEARTDPTSNFEFTWSEEDGIPTLTAEMSGNTQYRLQRVE